jgi:hypothetical protein
MACMKIKKIICFTLIIISLRAGELKKFSLPLDDITKQKMENSQNWKQLSSFMDLANTSRSQRTIRQAFIKSLEAIGTPKKDPDPSSYGNHVVALKSALLFLKNPKFYSTSPEEEHEIVKQSFFIQEELISLILYHAKERNRPEYYAKGKRYADIIELEKKRYYKGYYYLSGKKYQSMAHDLVVQAEREEDDTSFLKRLLYYTSCILYTQANCFYETSYLRLKNYNFSDELKRYITPNDDEEKHLEYIHQEAYNLNNDSQKSLSDVKDRIESMPSYKEYQDKLEELSLLIQENKNEFQKVLRTKNEIEDFEKSIPVLAKKKKARTAQIQTADTTIERLINSEKLSMDRTKSSKDKYQQNIATLHELLEKRDYGTLIVKAHEFEINEKKNGLYDKLIALEKRYIKLATMYLELFNLAPKKEYIEEAEQVMDSLVKIGEYKIKCNPHMVIVSDRIKELWEDIKAGKKIADHEENHELFAILREGEARKKEAVQWMI